MSKIPTIKNMVMGAIKELKDKKGAAAVSIKKFIQNKYEGVDMKARNGLVNKFLREAVQNGILSQTTGQGANGRFKLNQVQDEKKTRKTSSGSSVPKVKKPAAKKAKVTKVAPKKHAKVAAKRGPKAKTESGGKPVKKAMDKENAKAVIEKKSSKRKTRK